MVNDSYSSHAILMFTFNLFFIKCIISLKRSKFSIQFNLHEKPSLKGGDTCTNPQSSRKYIGNTKEITR